MSEPQGYDDGLDEFDDEPQQQQENANLQRLRENAKWAKQNRPRLTALERENAFLKAGIPVEDKAATYFVKGYDGALDPDAIRAAAAEIGLVQAPPEHGIPADEAAALRRTQALGNDSQSPVLNQVTEAEFNDMSMPERQRFLAQHGQEAHDAWAQGRPYTIG